MDAPSSATTRPSQTESTAPRIHPSNACGPCIAATTSGNVMNGPTPIISSIFRATALPRPMPRIRFWDCCGESACDSCGWEESCGELCEAPPLVEEVTAARAQAPALTAV